MSDRPDGPALLERLSTVRAAIVEAARASGRNPDDLTTVVVTKFQPTALVRSLAEAGVMDVGESRHQEARVKAADLSDLRLTWHFVGQVQTKKARQVARYAGVVHSLDRENLAVALAQADHPPDAFIQVNLGDDPHRGGVMPDRLESLVEQVLAAGMPRLLGVMAVAPQDEDPSRAFAILRGLSDRVRLLAPEADRISAGMSGDFREAILEGATHLRIGTAITGERPSRG